MADLTLDIYLAENCFGCDQAEALAADIVRWFPQVCVELHWLSDERRLPSGILAVPAFLLGGQLIQYGTPERRQVTETILRVLGADGGKATT